MLPGEGVEWAPGWDDTGRATVRRAGLVQTVDLTVDAEGRPLRVVIPRWSNANPEKTFRLQPFGGVLGGFRRFGGFTLPTVVDGGGPSRNGRPGVAEMTHPAPASPRRLRRALRRVSESAIKPLKDRARRAAGEKGRVMDRSGARQVAVSMAYIVLVGAVAVFAHSGLQGDHGLAALREAAAEERRLSAELESLRRQRAEMENRVLRLSDRYLDLDLLDERARAVLGLIREDELVVR